MYVYVVTTINNDGCQGISHEGYRTLSDAQKFVESRSDKPKKRTDFTYYSDELIYEIIEIKVVSYGT